MESIDKLIQNPDYRAFFQIIKSMRNGIVYGGRLRFAHSLVINLLFKRNISVFKRLSQVLRMTKDHSLILASYALIYKLCMVTLNQLSNGEAPINEFFAGCIGGALVYGNQTSNFNHSIAHQITLYCGARVLLGLGKLLAFKLARLAKTHRETLMKSLVMLSKPYVSNGHLDKKKLRNNIQNLSWLLFSSLTWGLVMYLHRFYPSFLQHGLESSMVYIYDDNKWNDFRTLLGF